MLGGAEAHSGRYLDSVGWLAYFYYEERRAFEGLSTDSHNLSSGFLIELMENNEK